MRVIHPLSRPVLGILLSATLLSGCVTNHETGNPEGWTEIKPAAVSEIAALVPPDIAAKGYLTMGTNPPFAPFEFKDSEGNIIGLEIDLGNALASVLGLELHPVEQDFSKILPAVSAGTLDFGGSGFTDTEERRASYDFVNSLYAGVQWAQQTGDHVDPNNPCGLTIAVQRTTVSDTDDVRPKAEKCLAEGKAPIEVLAYDSSDNAATALALGRADALSADSPVTSWAIERAGGKIETTGDMFQAAPYGFAVPKGSPLGPALAAAMQHLIDTGDYQRLMKQWNIEDGYLQHALINEKPVSQKK
ncbi:transporter substrate-binding domain-containing protein [Corynebacterium poyangense]|uniref:Transporter substrate-binding domain-containing protein n=1 Tax=Corynebacterium poyangense TaxID=2684405 RepID=A0A7H0SNL4_9CORY|nr:ABC transporter substrate-binding protein [Corynebacterium poyangense]MBZ8177172.1 transporter substrate-binding domain-containing protein [Corynebacterium poyangense]QNQ90139.1 transporter substrate-binding domain-containing protein [Corynebacterium poyangense]